MRKKLLTTICVFSALSMLCTTPAMAKSISVGDTYKQPNENKGILISNSLNCEELENTVLSLKVNCNIENLCEYLQNLISFNCNKNPEINGGITEPDMDTDIPEQDNNTPEVTDVPEQDNNTPAVTNVPEQDNNTPAVTDVPEQDSNTPTVTNVPETPEVTNVPEQDNSTPKPTVTPVITSTPVAENTDFVSQVAALVNAERAKVGISPVTLDTTLSKAAQVRAKEIVTQFSHTRPNGSSFSTAITEQGFSFRGSGENIAYGQKTPQAVMNAWMNSDGHRANILNSKYTKIGVGYYQQNGVNYWTQLFAY